MVTFSISCVTFEIQLKYSIHLAVAPEISTNKCSTKHNLIHYNLLCLIHFHLLSHVTSVIVTCHATDIQQPKLCEISRYLFLPVNGITNKSIYNSLLQNLLLFVLIFPLDILFLNLRYYEI